MELFVELLGEFWKVLRDMAPFLLLGFFLAGVFHVLVPTGWVVRQLGGRGAWPVIKAALIGIPVPLCSCGILPVAAQLRRAGASRGSTASFLISGPETDIDNIVITWGVMGPLFSVYRVVVSMVNSIGAGLLIDRFGGKEPAPAPEGAAAACCSSTAAAAPAKMSCCRTGMDEPAGCCSAAAIAPAARLRGLPWAWDVLRRSSSYAFITLPADLGTSLLFGLLVAAVLTLAGQWLLPLLRGADPVVGILGAMLLGLPMYVCSTASIPIAASLVYNAGLTPGAALAFMIAGPATNAAAVSLLWKLLGARSTMIYLGSIAVTAFGAGVLLDKVFMPPGHAFCGNCLVPLPPLLMDALGVAMLATLGAPLARRLAGRFTGAGGAGQEHAHAGHNHGTPVPAVTLQPAAACAHGGGCTCGQPAVSPVLPGAGLKLKRPGLRPPGAGSPPAGGE